MSEIDKREGVFSKARGFVDHFSERKNKAFDLLKAERSVRPDGTHLYFGIVNFPASAEMYDIGNAGGEVGIIRKLEQTPGEIELAGAISKTEFMSSVATYSYLFNCELIVPIWGNMQSTLNLAWFITCCLRIRTLSDFLVPVCTTTAWSCIPAISDNTCEIIMLDNYPKSKLYEETAFCDEEAIVWVGKNISPFTELMQNNSFRLAVEAFHSHNNTPNERLAAASLWSGLESLFNTNSEITFRISLYLATLLEYRGEARLSLFKRIKHLYGERSKIVHGRRISDDQLRSHIREVRRLLSRALVKITEEGAVPDQATLERMMLT